MKIFFDLLVMALTSVNSLLKASWDSILEIYSMVYRLIIGLPELLFRFVSLNTKPLIQIIVIPGLAIPELPGLEEAFHGPGLTTHYMASLSEWLLFVWAVGLAALLFLIGRRVLPIVHSER